MLDAFLSVADRAGARCNHLLRKCANLCADRQDFGRAHQIVIKLRLLALGPALFDGSNRREFSCRCHQPILTERSEEHTSELQSLMRISYAVFCLKKKKIHTTHN